MDNSYQQEVEKEQNNSLVQCSSCGVKIDVETNQVYFSYGKPGTRSKLYARVCQYAKDKDSCINKGEHIIKPGDNYLRIDEPFSSFSKDKYLGIATSINKDFNKDFNKDLNN